MLPITHQQARSLLQAATDKRIDAQEKTLLAEHVAACPDCYRYAQVLDGLQADLRRLTHQRWDRYSPAFSVESIRERAASANRHANPFANFGLTVKFAAVTLVVIMITFTLNLTGPRPFMPIFGAASAPAPGAVLQTPTPAVTKTATQAGDPTCQYGSHIVLQDETLADIAVRYAVAPERILEINHLRGTSLQTGMVLVIPVCLSTPTGTMTITPMTGLGSPTPLD